MVLCEPLPLRRVNIIHILQFDLMNNDSGLVSTSRTYEELLQSVSFLLNTTTTETEESSPEESVGIIAEVKSSQPQRVHVEEGDVTLTARRVGIVRRGRGF